MRAWHVLLPAALAGFALHGGTRAQSGGGPHAIPAHAIAAGGGRSTGGAFELDGTIAQHVVGPPASGGPFLLVPGFRRQRSALADGLFGDGFEDPR